MFVRFVLLDAPILIGNKFSQFPQVRFVLPMTVMGV